MRINQRYLLHYYHCKILLDAKAFSVEAIVVRPLATSTLLPDVRHELTMPSTHWTSSQVASHMFSTVMTQSFPLRFIVPMHRHIRPGWSRRELSYSYN